MIISADARISFPRSLVYTTYRDHPVEIVPLMPSIRHFEVKSRRQEDKQVYCVNEWHGGGSIPVPLRSILSEDMLSWTEYNSWNESDFTVDWQIKTHAFTEAVSCAGKNHFIADGRATIIKSRGELTINPNQLTGVPKFLKVQIAGVVEDFLSKKIEPNILQMSDGVRYYLEKENRAVTVE